MNSLNFSFTQEDLGQDSFAPIPAGNYVAQIINSEIKENRNGGRRLSVTFEIVDGDYSGRLIFENLNLWHDNQDTVRIAKQQLARICNAIGLTHVGDSSELHNRPMAIRVGIREDKTGQYDPQNNIKAYSAIAGGTAPQRAAPAAAPKAAPASSAAPWARKG